MRSLESIILDLTQSLLTSSIDDEDPDLQIRMLNEILEVEKRKRQSRNEKKGLLFSEQCTENEDHDAEWYCDTCNAVFCASCFATTHAAKVHSAHKKTPISEKPYQLPKCSKHPTNKAELVCTENECHPDPLCHTCLATSHQGHEIEELTVKINREKVKLCELFNDSVKKRSQLQSVIEAMTVLETQLSTGSEEYARVAREIEEVYEKEKTKALEKLKQASEKNMQVVKRIKKETTEELESNHEWNIRVLNATQAKSGFDFNEAQRLINEVRSEK